MFEKKTTKFGCLNGPLESMAQRGSRHYYNNGIAELAQHILDCHAEIDRRNDELTALRAQVAAEREWISDETDSFFPVSGFYLSALKDGTIDIPSNENDSEFKSKFHKPRAGRKYTLILAEKDFPVPPKPFEIKVGKYRWPDGDIASVWAIDKTGVCAYQSGLGVNNLRLVEKDELRRLFESHRVVFIGEGDNQ